MKRTSSLHCDNETSIETKNETVCLQCIGSQFRNYKKPLQRFAGVDFGSVTGDMSLTSCYRVIITQEISTASSGSVRTFGIVWASG
ncbi:hypothetical protein CEXT_75651 [Caerostris extrusa]|uniref:Uncharacterized protein n=1 Tax=Caerostris extrusa TaxID=172846 RepID=A0AAV4SVV3_CAEEX|nr:hypothetical protein CEXT_75651 [Caerostris extrusa]